MHGVPPETRLPEKAYRPEISEQVYGDMAWRAGVVLSAGGCVVANAVFDRPADRARIESAATTLGLPFLGIWLEAAPDILWQRVERRRSGTSDATVDILSRQLQRDAGTVGWQRIDASRSPPEIVGAILALPSG
jgi:predicted kinase